MAGPARQTWPDRSGLLEMLWGCAVRIFDVDWSSLDGGTLAPGSTFDRMVDPNLRAAGRSPFDADAFRERFRAACDASTDPLFALKAGVVANCLNFVWQLHEVQRDSYESTAALEEADAFVEALFASIADSLAGRSRLPRDGGALVIEYKSINSLPGRDWWLMVLSTCRQWHFFVIEATLHAHGVTLYCIPRHEAARILPTIEAGQDVSWGSLQQFLMRDDAALVKFMRDNAPAAREEVERTKVALLRRERRYRHWYAAGWKAGTSDADMSDPDAADCCAVDLLRSVRPEGDESPGQDDSDSDTDEDDGDSDSDDAASSGPDTDADDPRQAAPKRLRGKAGTSSGRDGPAGDSRTAVPRGLAPGAGPSVLSKRIDAQRSFYLKCDIICDTLNGACRGRRSMAVLPLPSKRHNYYVVTSLQGDATWSGRPPRYSSPSVRGQRCVPIRLLRLKSGGHTGYAGRGKPPFTIALPGLGRLKASDPEALTLKTLPALVLGFSELFPGLLAVMPSQLFEPSGVARSSRVVHLSKASPIWAAGFKEGGQGPSCPHLMKSMEDVIELCDTLLHSPNDSFDVTPAFGPSIGPFMKRYYVRTVESAHENATYLRQVTHIDSAEPFKQGEAQYLVSFSGGGAVGGLRWTSWQRYGDMRHVRGVNEALLRYHEHHPHEDMPKAFEKAMRVYGKPAFHVRRPRSGKGLDIAH